MRHLDVLTSHQHDVTNVEEVYPVESIAFLALRWHVLSNPQLISLRASIHVGVFLESINLFNADKAHLE